MSWNIIYWIFQCKYQFECLSSLETIYVIFILCCTIFHFLLFLDSLCFCLCLLFSHVQCCNHSDKLWERLKVSWTKLLCSEDFEMEKLVTDSSATSTLSSNTPLPSHLLLCTGQPLFSATSSYSLPSNSRRATCLTEWSKANYWSLSSYSYKGSSHPAWHRNDRPWVNGYDIDWKIPK